MVDEAYTADDHAFRENDAYAAAKYAITLRWLGPPGDPPRRLVNIGCGSGLFNRIAADAGFLVEACEPDPAAHAIAATEAPTGVVVHLGGVFDAPIEAGADIVVMHDVLEHIENEAAAVARARELVAPGGRIVVSVPALQQLYGFHDEMLAHYRRYNRKSLRRAFASGFEIHRVRYFGFAFIPVTAYYSRWRRKEYPTGAASGPTLVGRTFSTLCTIEARLPAPLGTSLLLEATRTYAK